MAGTSGGSGGPANPGAELDDLQAAVSGLANDLYRVETEPELHALRDPSALTGTSAARLTRAAADFSGVWARYSTLTDVLDRLAAAVAAGDRVGAAALVGPSAIEFADGSRCSPRYLYDSLRGEVDAILAAGAELAAAWRRVIPRVDAVTRRLAEVTATATAIGVNREPVLRVAAEVVERFAGVAATDPLSAGELAAPTEAALDRAAGRVGELAAIHAVLSDRLEAGRGLVAELARLIPEGRVALDAARQKIVEPDGLLEPLDPAAPDAGSFGLRPWLDRLEATAAAGQWLPASEGLDAWEAVACTWVDNARAVVAANRAAVEYRNELRGRLDAYAAKAGATGGAEDPALAALGQQARDALYSGPCNIVVAAGLVARYGEAVREAADEPAAGAGRGTG